MDNRNRTIKKNNFKHFMKESYCNCDACKYKAYFVPDVIVREAEYDPEDDEYGEEEED